MHLQPYTHKLLSIAGRPTASIEDVCETSWVVEPAFEQAVRPAIYLQTDLDRVTGAIEFTSLEWEMNSLFTPVREHAATIAYGVKDVSIVEGALYSGRWKERLMARQKAEKGTARENRVTNAVVACTWCGNHFFGHWITDDLPLHLAAEEIGDPLIVNRKPYLHEHGFREMLDIWGDPVANTHADDLIVLRDVGQNRDKKRRYDILRGRLKRKFRTPGATRVLLRRGRLGVPRDIVNCAEFEAYLCSQGFTILDPEQLTASEIIEKTMGAEIVVGVEGSQLPPALLAMSEGGVLCCLQPPWRLANTFKGYTDCLGMRYALLVGHAARGGFRIDLNDFGRLLEKMERELVYQ